ncbi:biotin--[acetyl-CoA-carboxylase] ligase [Parabacteroides sp. PF5-9]|uniref:biotin--[acetyl-CoA-carboxylase] ligase n=1 Tax=Parabacteroides sp. PF5-9 TaxID=1742404 RepID=UPI0024743498|nr:biotin--[acetyl-CoA-carboxylase] ligase [Parabacteroides sp. PF5-9]MDH6356678.1 BirA family biotin operon repressor/biotin-[acetyl-CoA-carboxylase] ligase [Parabacteroides sp. PF5-9]
MDCNQTEKPRIIRLKETESTNRSLRERLEQEKLPEGSVILADFQTAGRGQTGNSWESEAGKNLLFSIVIYPDCIPANRQFLISQITALSVKETLEQYTDGITVKWPNDIYRNDQKICGILIENDLSGSFIFRSVIGIGINLNQEQFISPAPNPVSLIQITGQRVDREEVFRHFLSLFYDRYLSLLQEKEEVIRTAYRQALYRGEGFYSYSDSSGRFEAEIYAIEDTGHLVLKLKDGTSRRYAFKEVTYSH